MNPLEKLKSLGLSLPASPKPQGWYIPVSRAGSLVFVSGQLPMKDGQVAYRGKVGEALSLEQGREAARLCLLNVLAALKGSNVVWDSVSFRVLGYRMLRPDEFKRFMEQERERGRHLDFVRPVKLTGYVQSATHFHEQPQVLNAASELLTDIFGEAGSHARAAVGANALPLDAAVEIEAVFEVSL